MGVVPLERQKNIADVAARLREQMGVASTEQGERADTALQPSTGAYRIPSLVGAGTVEIPANVVRVTVEAYDPNYAVPATVAGAAHYKRAAAEPAHALKFVNSGQWWEVDEVVLTPQMAGARGTWLADGIDDTAAIQKIVNVGRAVHFPPGHYGIRSRVRLPSGTRLSGTGARLHRDASASNWGMIFINWPAEEDASSPTKSTTAYSGWGDIVIDGLEFDDHGDTIAFASNTLTFCHAEDITIRNCLFRKVRGYHSVELNAIKWGRVKNCIFEGFVAEVGINNREAVQIDIAVAPSGGAADNTPAINCVIEGCVFRGLGALPAHSHAVGSHTSIAGKWYENIAVINNQMYGMGDRAISLLAVRRSRVSGNQVFSAGVAGLRLQSCEDVSVTDNQLFSTGAQGIVLSGTKGCIVASNRISGVISDAIYIETASSISADGNLISNNLIDQAAGRAMRINGGKRNLLASNKIRSAGTGGAAAGAIVLDTTNGAVDANVIENNAVEPHGLPGVSEALAGLSVAVGATNTLAIGNDFLGMPAAISGAVSTTGNRV